MLKLKQLRTNVLNFEIFMCFGRSTLDLKSQVLPASWNLDKKEKVFDHKL